jgi:hypothetical protein
MKKILSFCMALLISFAAFSADCNIHFKKMELTPDERWVKAQVGKYTHRFDSGFLHNRTIFKWPAKVYKNYMLSLRRIMKKFRTKATEKPIYFITNDEGSYVQIMEYVKSFNRADKDFTEKAMESVLKHNGVSADDINIGVDDLARITDDLGGEDLITKNVNGWVTKYSKYENNLNELYDEMAYRYHTIKELSDIKKRVIKTQDPYEVKYIIGKNVDGSFRFKTVMSNDIDKINTKIADQMKKLREIKGTLFKPGLLQKLRNEQAVLKVRLKYLKDELVYVAEDIPDDLMPPNLQTKIDEITKHLNDPKLTPDDIELMKLARKEYKAEWKNLRETKEEIEAKIQEYSNNIISKLSPQEKQILKISDVRKSAKFHKVRRLAQLPVAGLGAWGIWEFYRFVKYEDDLLWECVTGEPVDGSMPDDGMIPTGGGMQTGGGIQIGDPTTVPGVPGGYMIPEGEALTNHTVTTDPIPRQDNESLPIVPNENLGIGPMDVSLGYPDLQGTYATDSYAYQTNESFKSCIVERYLPEKYPDNDERKRFVKVMNDSDLEPFDSNEVNSGGENKGFMNQWNKIFVLRKEYMDRTLADQTVDTDAYAALDKLIKSNDLDKKETQITENPLYNGGGGVIIDPNFPPTDIDANAPIGIPGNPNIPDGN